jgi:multisubunit Na+/H+ antiporter MnhB subunit
MFKKIDLDYRGPDVFEFKSALYLSVCVASVSLLFVMLMWAVVAHPPSDGGLRGEITQNISLSGVKNPVTAVLLNFRAYDTLLEVAVLLIAALSMPQSLSSIPFFSKLAVAEEIDVVLDGLQQLVVPVTVLFAGYMLWTGANNPGGAFQAASLLAGAAVLLLQTGRYQLNFSALTGRLLVVFGLLVFLIAAIIPVFFGYPVLTFQPEMAGTTILVIESAATLSISLILLSLYYGLESSDTFSDTLK